MANKTMLLTGSIASMVKSARWAIVLPISDVPNARGLAEH